MSAKIACEYCLSMYDPIGCRWRCPWCGWKDTCCDGEPLPYCDTPQEDNGGVTE